MRATAMIGALLVMTACATPTVYEDPAPTGGAAATGTANPCNRADFAEGPAGDADYTNCVIQS